MHKGLFSNVVWIIYGLLFLVDPVYPERHIEERNEKISARIIGIIIIIVGQFTKFDV